MTGRQVVGRSPGFRVILPPNLPRPLGPSGYRVGFVTGHSCGAATDSHRLPISVAGDARSTSHRYQVVTQKLPNPERHVKEEDSGDRAWSRLRVNNVFDEDYEAAAGYPAPDLRFYGGIKEPL